MLRYTLPDRRIVLVERLDEGWHLQLTDEPRVEIVGTPLESTLAELLGYTVAHDSRPDWVDDAAADIERSLEWPSTRTVLRVTGSALVPYTGRDASAGHSSRGDRRRCRRRRVW